MFIFSSHIVPIGLGNHSRIRVVPPKRFAEVGKPGFMPINRGTNGTVTTKVYPETRDKYDFYATCAEDGSIPTEVTKDPIRREWNKVIKGLVPIAIRYRWNREEERIDSAFMVTPDGKSKIEIDERGNSAKIYFKPNSIVEQQLLGGKPLILKADIDSTQIAIVNQKSTGEFIRYIKMFTDPEVTERFVSREIVRDISKDDYGRVSGQWEKATDDLLDPRAGIDKCVLEKQLRLFIGHYNDAGARFEIISRNKSLGSPTMN